jgi:hypothetical protein
MSFADLAKKVTAQPTGFSGGFIGSTNLNQQAGGLFSNFSSKAPPMLFGGGTSLSSDNKKPTEEANGEEQDADGNQNPEEYEPQVEFKPLVKLHEVEVKTGEEDEEVLFKQRCKLFKFNSELKEWKEKGVGEIKILKHKIKENHYRVLMRRDQVLKLCANHRINASIKLENVNEKQLSWFVNDCSEEEPHAELLLAKFRHEEDAQKFKSEFENAQKCSGSLTKNQNTTAALVPSKTIENKISSLVKQAEEGSWKCDGCLTINKPNNAKCACCETPKPSNDTGH